MHKIIDALIISGTALVLLSTNVLAAANPQGTGRPGAPNESCGSGNATLEPKGFLTAGFAHAETKYNPLAQYDIACYQQTSNH